MKTASGTFEVKSWENGPKASFSLGYEFEEP